MTTPWSSEDPSAAAAGESERDSPAEVVHDDAEGTVAVDSDVPKETVDSPAAGDEALDPELQIQADIEELSAKAELADEYLSIAQRTQADFENYRKRATREAALAQERGIAKLAKELLPAIDNLERAVQAVSAYASAPAGADAETAQAAGSGPAGGPVSGESAGGGPVSRGPAGTGPAGGPAGDTQIVDGLRLVHAEVLAALGRAGIEPFSPVGEQFDPQHHEAVAQSRFEGTAPGTVIEVYQQGYRLGETVLRPARVLVAA